MEAAFRDKEKLETRFQSFTNGPNVASGETKHVPQKRSNEASTKLVWIHPIL